MKAAQIEYKQHEKRESPVHLVNKDHSFPDHARIAAINHTTHLQQTILCSWWLIIILDIMTGLPWTRKTWANIWDLTDCQNPQFNTCSQQLFLFIVIIEYIGRKQLKSSSLDFLDHFWILKFRWIYDTSIMNIKVIRSNCSIMKIECT